MSRELRVLRKMLQAAVLIIDAELVEEGPAPSEKGLGEADPTGNRGAANDQVPGEPRAKRRKGVRPVYRPEGPVDEVSARRADAALKRAGLLPVRPRRK